MKIKPLIWLRELIATALKSQTKRLKSRKVFFSTDTSKSAFDIFEIYRTGFQIEFCTVTQSNILAYAIARQGIATPWTSPLTCRFPQSILRDGSEFNTISHYLPVTSKYCYTMPQRSNDYFPVWKQPKLEDK